MRAVNSLSYNEELQKRIKNDSREMENAFADLVSIVSDKKIVALENEATLQGATWQHKSR